MNVLVAYASKHGLTAEIAASIAETLRRSGVDAGCVEAGDVRTLDPYDAVILGSAVYIGRWRREARHFLAKHDDELAARPFWVFSSGPVGEPKESEAGSGWLEPRRIVAKVEEIGARGHVVFGGRVPADPHGPMQRGMVENTPEEYRDRRDWDEIRAWAASIAADLQAVQRA